jgi:hypothetical protein
VRVLVPDRDDVDLPVPHTFLRDDRFGELRDELRRPTQDHGLDALIVIQVRMHGGHRHVVVLVMHGCEAARELPLVMVEEIAQRANAFACGALFHAFASDLTA